MNTEIDIHTLWVLLASVLVLLMQLGFLCLESGLTRSKNAINVAVKNVADFAISVVLFFVVGHVLMFGQPVGAGVASLSFFVFQALFCGTATTIVAGAVAERMTFRAYIITSIVMSAVLYPAVGQWVWGGTLSPMHKGWLESLGFIDFAGAGVVHVTGATVGLAFVLVLGPRLGRFGDDGAPQTIHGSDITRVMMGVFFLWVGWLGFNGGSLMRFDATAMRVIVVTLLGGAVGGVFAMITGWMREGRPQATFLVNGILAGLVSVTAGAHVLTFEQACFVAVIGASLMRVTEELLLLAGIDDVVSAFPVHGAPGIWAVIAVGLFAPEDSLGTGLPLSQQVFVQTTGVLSIAFASFVVGLVLAWGLKKTIGLRVTTAEELAGLNWSEHAVETALDRLQGDLETIAASGDYTQSVHAEPHTLAGNIAQVFNRITAGLRHSQARAEKLTEEAEVERALTAEANTQLSEQMDHMRNFQEILLGREMTIVTLKNDINGLCEALGRSRPYRAEETRALNQQTSPSVSQPAVASAMAPALGGPLAGAPAPASVDLLAGPTPANDVLDGPRPDGILDGPRPAASILDGPRPAASVLDGPRPAASVLDGPRPVVPNPSASPARRKPNQLMTGDTPDPSHEHTE